VPHTGQIKRDTARMRYLDRRLAGVCVICLSVKVTSLVYCDICRNKKKLTQKRVQNKLQNEVFAAYGGYRCSCCCETEPKFLSIDHVNNDGAQHRKNLGSNGKFYTWLRKNKYPPDYRVLCMNCNFGRARNGGVCPYAI
jgi:hypothetical protein